MPLDLLRDTAAFFGTCKKGRERADDLLSRAGDAAAIDEACRNSPQSKLLPTALYVHRSALDELDPLLRVNEGYARAYLGEIEEANILKLHRFIELDEPSSLPDGQDVTIEIYPFRPGDGIRASAGMWADAGPELDEWFKRMNDARQSGRSIPTP